MKYEYVYARMQDGFRCVNQEKLPSFLQKSLSKLESFKSYTAGEGIDSDNPPEEIYFYVEDTPIGEVGVIGRTVYVNANTSVNSGSRGTSMIQKFIYTDEEDEDFSNLLENCESIFEPQKYYNNVDDYFSKMDVDPIDYSAYSVRNILDDFEISADSFLVLLQCCIDSFASFSNRVYITLPTNDRDGSIKALQLIRFLFKFLSPSILKNAGFVTYVPSFDNISTSPIPGNVSIVFIPHNDFNESHRDMLPAGCFYFDFKKKIVPQIHVLKEIEELYKPVLNKLLGGESEAAKQQILSVETALTGIYKKGMTITSEALSVMKRILGFLQTVPSMSIDEALNVYANDNEINDLVSIFALEQYITPNIINTIEEHIKSKLFANSIFTDSQLELAGKIYANSYDQREEIVRILCEKCKENCKNEDVLFNITDFDYYDSDLNDILVGKAYSDPEFFDVGLCLFDDTIKKVLPQNPRDDVLAKVKKILSFIRDDYQQKYLEFIQSGQMSDELYKIVVESSELVLEGFRYYEYTEEIDRFLNEELDCIAPSRERILFTMWKRMAKRIINEKQILDEMSYVDRLSEIYFNYYHLGFENEESWKELIRIVEEKRIASVFDSRDIRKVVDFFKSMKNPEIRYIIKHFDGEIRAFINNHYYENNETRKPFMCFFSFIFIFDLTELTLSKHILDDLKSDRNNTFELASIPRLTIFEQLYSEYKRLCNELNKEVNLSIKAVFKEKCQFVYNQMMKNKNESNDIWLDESQKQFLGDLGVDTSICCEGFSRRDFDGNWWSSGQNNSRKEFANSCGNENNNGIRVIQKTEAELRRTSNGAVNSHYREKENDEENSKKERKFLSGLFSKKKPD